LFEKNADDLTAPASLAKLLTVEVAFDRIRKGQLDTRKNLSAARLM